MSQPADVRALLTSETNSWGVTFLDRCIRLSGAAQEPLKSGPKVGDEIPGSFYPLNITGADAGKKRCLV